MLPLFSRRTSIRYSGSETGCVTVNFIHDMRAGYSLFYCERNARSSFLLLNFLLIFHLNYVIIIMSEREVILWPK